MNPIRERPAARNDTRRQQDPVAQDPLAQIFGDRLASQRYAVGVPKGHDDVVRQVNFTIERIRGDGTWNAMYNEWLKGSLSESWLPRQMYRKEEDS